MVKNRRDERYLRPISLQSNLKVKVFGERWDGMGMGMEAQTSRALAKLAGVAILALRTCPLRHFLSLGGRGRALGRPFPCVGLSESTRTRKQMT